MEKKLRESVILLIAVWGVLHISGCSLFGFVLGVMGDATTPDEDVFLPTGVDSIKRGTTINVMKIDSTIVSGEYAGLQTSPDEGYAVAYNAFLAASPLARGMPALGDTVRIITRGTFGRGEHSGQFIGFAERALRLQPKINERASGVFFDYIDTVYHTGGGMVIGDTLRQHIANGEVPLAILRTRLILPGDNGTMFIPAHEILAVRSPNSHNRKWWGLGIGAAIDAALIVNWWNQGWKLY